MLLGQLKEDHTSLRPVGVVPKDLGPGFFKDLLDLDAPEENKKIKNKSVLARKLKKEKSFHY